MSEFNLASNARIEDVVKEIGANGDEYKTDGKCKNRAHNHR